MLLFGREISADHRLVTVEKHTKQYETSYFENFMYTLFNSAQNVDLGRSLAESLLSLVGNTKVIHQPSHSS